MHLPREPRAMSLHLNYGGTFDPVHHGHLEVARSAARQLGSVVHLVPCADPPHRARPVASAAQRAEMLRLAIADDPDLALDLRELRRAGASFTLDTARELRAELGPGHAVAFLIGADAFRGLEGWRGWRELLDLIHVVALTRPGHRLDGLSATLEAAVAPRRVDGPEALREHPGGLVLALDVPAWEVSSTTVRAALANGECPHGVVPAAVLAFIAAERLYASPLRVP
jgi:nicotinate-nucleotide adenylyltransferase